MESYQYRLLHFGKATYGCDFGEKLKNGRRNKHRREGHENPCGGQ